MERFRFFSLYVSAIEEKSTNQAAIREINLLKSGRNLAN